MSFDVMLKKHFSFLEDAYGFSKPDQETVYAKNGLHIEFYQGNGQLDVQFFVNRNDEIFKPFVSRSFYVHEVVKKLGFNPEPYAGGYVISDTDIEACLTYHKRLIKEYCKPILTGDLSVLEEMHLARRLR